MRRTRLSPCIVLLLACTSSPSFDPDQHAALLQDAHLRMQIGEVDEALILTDQVLAENPNDRQARLLAARGSLILSELGRSNTAALISDGINNYELALALEDRDPDTWLELSRAYLRGGRFEEGREAAIVAARQLQADAAGGRRIAEAVIAAADNELQTFVDYRRAEIESPGELDANGTAVPSEDTLALASRVLTTLFEAKQWLPGEAYRKSALVYQWLGQDSNALSELERGLDAAPAEEELHIAYQSVHFSIGRHRELAAAYRRLARETPGAPMVQRYLGRAQFGLADLYRQQGDRQQATVAYEAARDTFERFGEMEPRSRELADGWLAMCELSLGRLALDAGELERAVQHYVAAYDHSPLVAEVDDSGSPRIIDSFGGTYIGGLDMIGRALGGGGIDAEALALRLAHYEWMIERHPDRYGFLYNNAGYVARDLGIAREAEGGADNVRRAMELWENSYRHYEKAVELSPDDPRILNDCAVLLVYHLKRDFDRAAELFARAIELGQPQLDNLGFEATAEQREQLEEAVGDAYQNRAVMKIELGRPFAEYRDDLEKAVAYFPYQQRDASIMLRNGGQRVIAAPTAIAARTAQEPQDPRKSAFEKIAQEASAKADGGDLDGALLILDEAFRDMNGYAPFHYYLGLYSFRYANQARDSGGSSVQIQSLYDDASRHLQRAVELDPGPVSPRLTLGEVYHETGEFDKSAEIAGALFATLRDDASADPQTLRTCQTLLAKAASRAYIDAKQAQRDDTRNLLAAREAFQALETSGALDETMVQSWSTMEQWAGANANALEVVGRATARFPESGALHGALIELADRGLAAEAVAFLEDRDDAFGLWYLGRARFALSDQSWMGSRLDDAVEALDTAVEDFSASMRSNPAYTDSCEQWISLCLGKKGMVMLAMDDLAGAEAALLEAARLRPDRIEEPLGGNDTVKRGLMIVGDRYFRSEDLANAQRLFGAASKAVPQDIDFANNHGLFARDHGVELEREERTEEAMQMFEDSYQAYTRASQLDPESVRLLNDRALMLVHHLKRDWDIALRCLQQGVELGEQQMADDPPSDPDERQVLEEALGDCYENLGLYHLEHTGDLVKAEANYRKALEFYPKQRRPGTRRGLRQVEERKKDGQ